MGDIPDFTAKTIIVIDSSQALAGAADFERAADQVGAASKRAADSADALSGKVETTSTTLQTTARQLRQNEAALLSQSAALGGTAAATIEAQRQLTALEKASKGVTDAMHSGLLTVEQGNAELALLGTRQDLVTQTSSRLKNGFIDGAAAMAILKGSTTETAVASEVLATAHGHVGGSASKMREGLVLVHEFLSGNYKRAIGSGTIELQNFFGAQGLVSIATNPLVLGLVAGAAAFAAIALSASRYREEVLQLNIGLLSTSRGIGLTTDGLLNIAKATASAGDISQSEARKVVAAVEQIGNLSAASLAFAAENGKAFGKIIGQDATKGAEDLGKALADPVKGLAELDARFHFLDPALRQYIRDLVDSGQAEKAQEEIRSRIAPQLTEIIGKVKETSGAFHDLGLAATAAYDNLRLLAGDASLSERIAAMAQQLLEIDQARAGIQRTKASAGGAYLSLLAQPAQAQVDAVPTARDLEDLEAGRDLANLTAIRQAETEAMRKQALEATDLAAKYAGQTAETHKLQSEELLLSQAIAEFGSRATDTLPLLEEWQAGLAAVRQKIAEIKTPLQQFIDQIKEQDSSIKLQAEGFGKSSAAQLQLRLTTEARTKGYVDSTGALLADVKAVIDSAVADQKKLDGLVAMKPVLDEHVAALNKATESMKAFDDKVDLKGLLPGAALVKEYNDKLADLDTRIATITSDLTHFSGTAAEHTKITLDLAKATDERTRAESDGAKVLQTAADLNQKAHDTAFKRVEELEAEAAATAGGARSLALFNELKKEAVERSQIYTSVLEEQTKELGNVTDAQDAANAAADRAVAALRKTFDVQQLTADAAKVEHVWEQTFTQMAKRLDDTIVRSLADAFDGKKLQNWGDTLKQILSQVAAEIVNIALIKPAIGSTLLSIGLPQAAQAFGVGGGAAAAAGAAGTGGASPASLLGSGFSLGNSFGGGLGGLSSSVSSYLFGTAGNGIQMGSNGLLTMGAGAPIGTETVMPATNGLIGSGGGIGGVSIGTIATGLGGIAGVAGGILGLLNSSHQNALGITADVAQIGGGVAALGAAIGIFGAATGGIGLVVAAVAAIAGMLFGNKHPEHPTGQAEAILNASGGGTGNFVDFTTDHGNAAPLHDAVNQMLIPLATAVAKQFGADLTGTRLGILNNAGTTSFATGKVGDNNPKDQSQPLSQLFQFDQKDQASINDALTHVTLALIQMAAKVDNADLSVARFNIDINDTAANIQKALTFVMGFRGALDALSTGAGFDLSKSIIGKAQSDAAALFGQIKDFLDTTTKLFPDGAQIKDAQAAVKNYVEILIGLRQPVDSTLTAVEAAVKTLKANIDALKPVFDQVGISAEQAQEALARGMAALKDQVNASIQQQLDTIQNPALATARAALQKVASDYAINVRDAAASGADQAKVLQLGLLQAGAAMQGLTENDLVKLQHEFLGAAGGSVVFEAALHQMGISIGGAADTLAGSASSVDSAFTTMTDAARQMADGFAAQAAAIKATIESLLTGSLTTLSPRDQLAEAQRQFQANPNATTAQSLLQLGQSFYGGATVNYADLFHGTLSTLANTGANLASSAATRQIGLAASLNPGAYAGVDIGAIGDAASAGFLNSLPHFDKGGTVPGRIGAPQLIVAHGGEKVTPANDNSWKAIVAELQALRGEVAMLRGDTVAGADKIARVAKAPADIQSRRKG